MAYRNPRLQKLDTLHFSIVQHDALLILNNKIMKKTIIFCGLLMTIIQAGFQIDSLIFCGK
jgi:hypothetical protein